MEQTTNLNWVVHDGILSWNPYDQGFWTSLVSPNKAGYETFISGDRDIPVYWSVARDPYILIVYEIIPI